VLAGDTDCGGHAAIGVTLDTYGDVAEGLNGDAGSRGRHRRRGDEQPVGTERW